MIETLLACKDQQLYRTRVGGVAAVTDLVVGRTRVETITSTDGSFVFWFAADPIVRVVNRPAVRMLLATTRLKARNVPLLRGNVVVSGRDASGGIASLTKEQIDWLVKVEPRIRQHCVLGRRYAADVRAVRQQWRADEAARQAAWWNA